LPAREGERLRPLIRARRSDVLAHLERHGVPFASDPSNRDRRFLRARVREEVLPLLTDLSPGIVGHLNALADALLAGPELAVVLAGARDKNVPLGRAHLLALARARRLGQRRAKVRLPGGWEARVDPRTGEILLNLAALAERR
jgi:tRNA(Ile)-lysidine synthase